MRGLHVLDLSYTLIEYLPSSISNLEELNALLLGCCWKLVFVPPLENLKALKELDLSYTGIKEIPQGLESLTILKCLDTVGSRIETIPTGFSQGMSLLQRLTLPTWMTIPVEQVAGLKQLEEFQGKFRCMHDFNIFMKSRPSDRQLSFYDIQIGDRCSYSYHNPERLAFKLVTFGKDSLKKGETGKDEIMLPRDIEYLRFDQCGLSSCLFDDFQQLNNPTELKHCYIEKEDGIECILRLSLEKETMAEVEQQSYLIPLHYLESLHLQDLQNFFGLIKWEVVPAVAPFPHGPFSHLQRLEVVKCAKIKKLLPLSLVQNLQNLNILKVDSCAELEEIIGDDEIRDLGAESIITLPRLKNLYLIDLPKLESICKGSIICDSIEEIDMEYITKVRKLPLFLPPLNGQPSPPPSFKKIVLWKEEKGWWESLEWDQPNAKSVLQPFVNYI
ncbi:disease resistance protein At4g27190-like [Olea europaea var. sylvestris]|uniref:disease resistance protein At4g27190-like n=1 Tax=Olea europaea var. sylvestris TaxID=158386 RepID=UPI000C1D80DC|nr:disease resistance protein At4g27190-like [Olea europaea var. sylvestris]